MIQRNTQYVYHWVARLCVVWGYKLKATISSTTRPQYLESKTSPTYILLY